MVQYKTYLEEGDNKEGWAEVLSRPLHNKLISLSPCSVYTSPGQILLRLFAFSLNALGCGLKDNSVFLSLKKITCQLKIIGILVPQMCEAEL